ncbi:hypothetical protein SAMN05519105_2262 [Rhodobacter sp. 24-YEA-8]|nr:hypothetical protein SAMN05519105_2262 [Rhodobacter sp. 24-YEA-8]
MNLYLYLVLYLVLVLVLIGFASSHALRQRRIIQIGQAGFAWNTPTEWSGLNVSALSACGPFARRSLGPVAGSSERCGA